MVAACDGGGRRPNDVRTEGRDRLGAARSQREFERRKKSSTLDGLPSIFVSCVAKSSALSLLSLLLRIIFLVVE